MRHASSPPSSGEYIALSAPFLITEDSDRRVNGLDLLGFNCSCNRSEIQVLLSVECQMDDSFCETVL